MNDLPNAADEKSLRKQAKAARQIDVQRQEIMRGIMSVPAGREWLYSLLERYAVFRTVFSTSGLQMAFNEGQRNAGLQLLTDAMDASPDQFIAMLRENRRERSTGNGGQRRDQQNDGWDDSTAPADEPAWGDRSAGPDNYPDDDSPGSWN